MLGADSRSPSILGLEVGATVVRAVVVQRGTSEVVAAAEAGISNADEYVFDANAIRPALGEVMYQLAELAPESMMAAISIGPPQSGVGSGPALPPWLERQARNLGQNLICAGDLGVAFCPQAPLDLLISLCEEAAITVARVDLAPMAAARLLAPGGADTIVIGSGRGWRARLRNDEVLEALHSDEIDIDHPMAIVELDGQPTNIETYHGVGVASVLDEEFELNLGQLAPAVGAAMGIIDVSPANLLDGATVVGRAVPVAHGNDPGGLSSASAAAGGAAIGDDVANLGGSVSGATGFGGRVAGPEDESLDRHHEPATAGEKDVIGLDELVPLDTDDAGSGVSPGYMRENGQAFMPGQTEGQTTVDLSEASLAQPAKPDNPFDASPMLIERQPARSPSQAGVGDGGELKRAAGKTDKSFAIALAVLLGLIVLVAVFIITR